MIQTNDDHDQVQYEFFHGIKLSCDYTGNPWYLKSGCRCAGT